MAASKRISEFTDAANLDGTDFFILEKNGITYRTNLSNISEYKRYGKVATAVGNGTLNLDLTLSDLFVITLTGNVTIGIEAFNAAPMSFMLRLKQNNAGGHVATFSSDFKFPTNTVYTLGAAAGDIEWFVGHHIESNIIELMKANGPFNLSV